MTNILPLTLFAVSTAFTPGPNNIMLAASGANFGIRRTWPHILGISVGFPFMVVAVGLGLGNLFNAVPVIWKIMRIAGFIFLLFLAWKIATFHPREQLASRGEPLNFWQAALFQWLNPKAWVLVMVAIPAYTSVEEAVVPQVLLISFVYLLVSLPATLTWTIVGTTLRRWLDSTKRRRLFNGALAALLIASVAFTWLFHRS